MSGVHRYRRSRHDNQARLHVGFTFGLYTICIKVYTIFCRLRSGEGGAGLWRNCNKLHALFCILRAKRWFPAIATVALPGTRAFPRLHPVLLRKWGNLRALRARIWPVSRSKVRFFALGYRGLGHWAIRKSMSLQDKFADMESHLAGLVVGQKDLLDRMLVALLCDGHLLVEGAPGLAKTRAIKVLSHSVEGDFHRLQFTPDLLPADLTGTEIYRPQDGSFVFREGPLFHNLILADEVNRAPAKVQAALLEAMGERQITVGSVTYRLPELYMVMATRNPIEQEGTYPLPEAQLDRFLMHVLVDYPNAAGERAILEINRREASQAADDAALFEPTNVLSQLEVMAAPARSAATASRPAAGGVYCPDRTWHEAVGTLRGRPARPVAVRRQPPGDHRARPLLPGPRLARRTRLCHSRGRAVGRSRRIEAQDPVELRGGGGRAHVR